MEKTRKGLKSKALMTGAALISLSAGAMNDAHAASGSMSAIVLTPIVVTGTAVINFGSVTVQASSGTVVVRPVGADTVTGGVTAYTTVPSAPGSISIAASTGVAIDLVVGTAGVATVTHSTAVDTMAVSLFNVGTDAGGGSPTVTNTGATDSYAVGATLTVALGQAPGTYTGTYNLTAAYQ